LFFRSFFFQNVSVY